MSQKLTAQVRRYDRRYDRVQKARKKVDQLDRFIKKHLWHMAFSTAGVGASLGVLFGSGWDHLGNAALGAVIGFFAALTVIPLTVLASLFELQAVPDMLLKKTAHPSEAERLLYRLEQYRKNPALDWLADDLDAALPAARRAAKTGRALRKASTTANATTARRGLGECLPGLQVLAGRCFSEAEKAVTVQKTREEVPCYLYTSDAEDVRRTAAVADAVAKFRDETLSRQEHISK